MQATKDTTRAEVLVRIDSILPDAMNTASEQIRGNLSRVLSPTSKAPIVTFLPVLRGEPDFLPALEQFAARSELYAVSPTERRSEGELIFHRLAPENFALGSMSTGTMLGGSPSISSSKLNPVGVVLVPGLAFDRQGHRLGRGGGFYDQLLVRPEFRPALKVAVCLHCQILERVPTEPHDVPVDVIVTEDEILSIRTPNN